MDILDMADETQQTFMRVAMSNVPAPTTYHGIGMCLNCGAGVDGERRWCDSDCRNDWERHARK